MTAQYKRGDDGRPTPITTGIRKTIVGRFEKPAHGTVVLERVGKKSSIIAPSADAEAEGSEFRIAAFGEPWYAWQGCKCPFNFEVGDTVILTPKPTFVAEPSSDTDSEGLHLRVLVRMQEVLASVVPPGRKFDA